jgi:GNAT superfamily N-acetyltransferase
VIRPLPGTAAFFQGGPAAPIRDTSEGVLIRYRTLGPGEVPAAADVFLTTLADLARRNGLLPPASYTHATVEPVYEHLRATGIFEVGELDGRLVTIASAVVRDQIGFLSMFWTLPDLQQRGIGRPLLERVLDQARACGAGLICTWSSVDFAAIGTYLKLGMLPGGPIFTFAGSILRELDPACDVVQKPLDPTAAAAIDIEVRGTARLEDHAFWRRRGVLGFQIERAGNVLGYFYAGGGAIGPAAWLDPHDGPALLSCALVEARAQAPTVRLMTIGTNEVAIRTATSAGLRIVGTAHWRRSASFGALDQYMPSGPALF